MMNATDNTSKWSANRISKSVDCLWISGVLLINVAVGLLFEAKYIGLALVGFFFFFVLCARPQLKKRFPPIATRLYRDSSNFVSSKLHLVGQQEQQQIKAYKKSGPLIIIGAVCFSLFTPWDALFISKAEFGILIPIAIINCVFLIFYRRLFIGLNGDCFVYRAGVYRANKYEELAEYWASSIAFLRPTGLIVAVIVLSGGALWLYETSIPEALNGNTAFGVFMPSCVCILLFEFCYVALISIQQRQLYP